MYLSEVQFSIKLVVLAADKSGFSLRDNPASGISAALGPAKVVRVRLKSWDVRRVENQENIVINQYFTGVDSNPGR